MSIKLDQHICVLGTTSSGKTYFATKLFIELKKICIFFNTQHEVYPERYSNSVVSTLHNFEKALAAGKTKIVFDAADDQEEKEYQLEEIRKILFRYGEIINSASQRQIWVYLFIDEIHLFGEKKGIPTLNSFFTNGLRYGILCIAISQRPALASHTVLTQSGIHVYFNMEDYERKYLERYGLNYDLIQDWCSKKYHFIIKKGTETEKYTPISLRS